MSMRAVASRACCGPCAGWHPHPDASCAMACAGPSSFGAVTSPWRLRLRTRCLKVAKGTKIRTVLWASCRACLCAHRAALVCEVSSPERLLIHPLAHHLSRLLRPQCTQAVTAAGAVTSSAEALRGAQSAHLAGSGRSLLPALKGPAPRTAGGGGRGRRAGAGPHCCPAPGLPPPPAAGPLGGAGAAGARGGTRAHPRPPPPSPGGRPRVRGPGPRGGSPARTEETARPRVTAGSLLPGSGTTRGPLCPPLRAPEDQEPGWRRPARPRGGAE